MVSGAARLRYRAVTNMRIALEPVSSEFEPIVITYADEGSSR